MASTSFRLLLPRSLYEEMLAQARAELPSECCGMLAGRIVDSPQGKVGQVERRFPLINAAETPAIEYLSEAKSLFTAVRAIDREGLDVLAVYHSHPTSAPVPSKKDLARNYSTEVMSLVISLVGTEPVVRAWWLTESDACEADWEISEA